jgi:hypothetical protein
MKQKIEYIAVIRKWWDKQNGNSYFSAQVFDIHMRLIKVLPFQYGNDSEHIIASWVQAMNPIHEHIHDVTRKIYFDRNDTTKRDCVALGKAIVDGDDE